MHAAVVEAHTPVVVVVRRIALEVAAEFTKPAGQARRIPDVARYAAVGVPVFPIGRYGPERGVCIGGRTVADPVEKNYPERVPDGFVQGSRLALVDEFTAVADHAVAEFVRDHVGSVPDGSGHERGVQERVPRGVEQVADTLRNRNIVRIISDAEHDTQGCTTPVDAVHTQAQLQKRVE